MYQVSTLFLGVTLHSRAVLGVSMVTPAASTSTPYTTTCTPHPSACTLQGGRLHRVLQPCCR
jgi:hypothetical protein